MQPGALGETISPWTAPAGAGAASGAHVSAPNALMAMDAQGPGCDMALITANNLAMGGLLSAGHMQLRNSASVDVGLDPRREALDEVVQLLHEHKRRSHRPGVQVGASPGLYRPPSMCRATNDLASPAAAWHQYPCLDLTRSSHALGVRYRSFPPEGPLSSCQPRPMPLPYGCSCTRAPMPSPCSTPTPCPHRLPQDRSGNTGSSDVGSVAPGTATTSMAAAAATTTGAGTSLLHIAAPTATAPTASGAVTGGHNTPSPGLDAATGANRLLPLLGGLGYDAPTPTPSLTNAAGGAGSNRVSFETTRGSSGLVNNLGAAAGGGQASMEGTGAGAAGSQLAASGSGTGNDLAGLGVTGGGGVTLPSGGSGAGLRSRGSDVLLNHMAQLQAQLQAQSLQQQLQQQQQQQRMHPLCQLGLSASLDSAMAGQQLGGFGSVQGGSQQQQQQQHYNTTGAGSMSSAATTIAGGYATGMGHQRDGGPASQPMPHLGLRGHGQQQQQASHLVPLMQLSFEEQLRQQQQQLSAATNLYSEGGLSQFFTAGSLVHPSGTAHGNMLQQQQQAASAQGQGQELGGEVATWRRLMQQQQPHRDSTHQQHGAQLTLDRLNGGNGHGNGGGRGGLQLGAGADVGGGGGGGAVAHSANVVGLHPGWGNGGLLGLGLGLGACSGPAGLRPEDIPEDLFMSLDDFVPQDL